MKSLNEIMAGRSDGVGNARGWVESCTRFRGEETKRLGKIGHQTVSLKNRRQRA